MDEYEDAGAAVPTHQKRIIRRRKRTKAGRFVDEITVEELTQVMNLPAQQAAQSTGVSFTVFKKICRKFGLERWPYRRLNAMGLSSPPQQLMHAQPPPPSFLLPAGDEDQHPPSMPAVPSNSEPQQPGSKAPVAATSAEHSSGDAESPPDRSAGNVNACLGLCSGPSHLAEAALATHAKFRHGGQYGGMCCEAAAAAASRAPSPTPMAVDRHPLAAGHAAPAAAQRQRRLSITRLLAEAMAVARDEGTLHCVLRTLLGEVQRRLAARPADPLQEAALIRLRAATQKRLRNGPAAKPAAAQQPLVRVPPTEADVLLLQGLQRRRAAELAGAGAALTPSSPAPRHTATPGVSDGSGFARFQHAGGMGSQSPREALPSPFAAPEVQRCPLPIRPRLVPLLPGLLELAVAPPPPPQPLPLHLIMARLEGLQQRAHALSATAQW